MIDSVIGAWVAVGFLAASFNVAHVQRLTLRDNRLFLRELWLRSLLFGCTLGPVAVGLMFLHSQQKTVQAAQDPTALMSHSEWEDQLFEEAARQSTKELGEQALILTKGVNPWQPPVDHKPVRWNGQDVPYRIGEP